MILAGAGAPLSFAVEDAAPDTQMQALLTHICAVPDLQARFLNTLSLMEHIGSRKIMASQSRGGGLDGSVLKHLAEETRHAFFFKRAAEALTGRAMGYGEGDVLAGAQARFYMGRLDAFVARTVSGRAAYLSLSLLIEIRAVWFYRQFQNALKQSGQTLKLAGLLAEEQGHLAEMRGSLERLAAPSCLQLGGFIAYEEGLFARLAAALRKAVAAPPGILA